MKRDTSPGKAPDVLLASALESQSEGVLIMERRASAKGFTIVHANEHFCSMTGYSLSEVLGRRNDFLHDNAGELQRMKHWLSHAQKGCNYEGEGNLLNKDGHAMQASWSYSPMVDGGGNWTHLVAIYRDVTDKNRMLEAMMTAQRLDAVGRMAGGVAHDFNNLVSVINGFCQLLVTKLAGRPEFQHELEEIQKAGQKAASLTRQLLALGRKQPMVQRILDLNEFLRGCTEILERVVGDTGKLEISVAEKPLLVKADPDQLEQVLLNLVLNARDALRARGCIAVSSFPRKISRDDDGRGEIPPGSYAVLTVKDNGVGMDADTLGHIFEPFFTTKSAEKGSGLGLALVYGSVQQSGGFIRVTSTLLVGSTFEILLPLCEKETASAPQRPQAGTVPSTRGHETVLLIESDVILAKMLSGMLAAEGYRVLEANDSRSAELLIRRERSQIHLLLGAIGDEAECRRLHGLLVAQCPSLRVLCTASCGKDCHAAKNGQNCNLCLPKPFAISELLKSVRLVLDH